MVKAEIEWLDGLVSELESGALDWSNDHLTTESKK
jgi:hypothetical protein